MKIKKPLKSAGNYYRYYIALYNSSQTLVALRQTTANYDTEYIRCKVPASGYYYIKVYGGENNYTNALTYTLTIK